jgi:O-antigen/teichoic acid export membrane protein
MRRTYQGALVWGALLMAANVLRGIQSGIIAAVERFDLIAKLNVLEGVVSLVSMVVLAHYWGVQGALLGLAAAAMAVWIVGRVMLGGVLKARGIAATIRSIGSRWSGDRLCSKRFSAFFRGGASRIS